jgi:CheY-like chemotaxis protein
VKRLLAVDDDPDVLDGLELVLGEAFEVVVAANGRQAADLLAGDTRFDVMLLDLMMPVMTGTELVAWMRTQKIDLPVVLGSASDDLRELAATLGLRFVAKPYDFQALEQVLLRAAREGV